MLIVDKIYQAYRAQWNAAGTGTITDAPTHLDIELSAVCDLKCIMCPQSETHTAFKRRFMPRELAMRLLDEAKEIGILSVKLNWRGESHLHPNFPEIVQYAMSKGFVEVMLNTNGSYQDKRIRRAINRLDHVIFSMDAWSQKVTDIVRPGLDCDILKKNIIWAGICKRYYGKPERLTVNFTEQVANKHESEWVRQFCLDNDAAFRSKPVFPRNPPKVDQYFDDSAIRVMGRRNCGFPFQRLVVSWDGFVAPCCVPWTNDLFVGDVTRQSLMDIWRGEELSRIREDALKADYKHPTCQGCTSWASYDVERTS